MRAYYNDSDSYVCTWLRNLIALNLIAPGDVDDRPIEHVTAGDLRGYSQCHFFAGIGVWSYALRKAGWPDDRPIWTGSCPCQLFSGAGARGGIDDERHLWPEFYRLIGECKPCTIIGEQVASKDGLGWWDIVSNNLENSTYAAAALDLCVPGVGGPHMRQRLYWLADANQRACGQGRSIGARGDTRSDAFEGSGSGGGVAGRLGNAESLPWGLPDRPERLANSQFVGASETGGAGPLNGFWRDADWIFCTDGKWRPVEPGSFPLAHGATARVGRLRAYGNAIVAPQAIQFIETVMEIITWALTNGASGGAFRPPRSPNYRRYQI